MTLPRPALLARTRMALSAGLLNGESTRITEEGRLRMDGGRRLTVSVALIVLVCFFLPWVQLSCGGAHDTSSGVDLARGGDNGLWLIPVLTLVIILFGVIRVLEVQRTVFGLISLLSGLVNTYLLNHERLKFSNTSGLIAVRLTGWFWLALLSSAAIAVLGAFSILRRRNGPSRVP